MTISDTNKLDFVWKKLIYGNTKTDTDLAKTGFNESIPSYLPVYNHNIWGQTSSIEIPSTPPLISTATVELKLGLQRIATTADITSGGPGTRPTWISGLLDWIPPIFGSLYQIKVYLGDPLGSGVQIFPGTPNQEWVFDYQTGILHFAGGMPLTHPQWSNGVFIEGYRYIGSKGTSSVSNIQVYRANFIDSDLVLGIYDVTHNLNNLICHVQIYDENNQLVKPDDITMLTINTCSIDLTSFAPLSGTWSIIVIG